MTTASGSRRRSHEPSNILRGAPVSVASSRPRQKETANLPPSVRATGLPLNSLTAHCTPVTPRTRVRSVSLRALVCSKYSVLGSITQISASVRSAIWLPVRLRMPAKMDVWFCSRNVQKAMVKIRPRYLARSPVSILRATKFMVRGWVAIDSNHFHTLTLLLGPRRLLSRRGNVCPEGRPGPISCLSHRDSSRVSGTGSWGGRQPLRRLSANRLVGISRSIKKFALRFQSVQIIEKGRARLLDQFGALSVFRRTHDARLDGDDKRRHIAWRDVFADFSRLDAPRERRFQAFPPFRINLFDAFAKAFVQWRHFLRQVIQGAAVLEAPVLHVFRYVTRQGRL